MIPSTRLPRQVGEWEQLEGQPWPLGATWLPQEQSWNFALYSQHATQVTVLVYAESDTTTPIFSLSLDPRKHKTGRIWHCRLSAAATPGARYYAWRVAGPWDPARGHRFDGDKVLLDPYARVVHFPKAGWREAASRPGPNDGLAPLGELLRDPAPFDWGHASPPRHTHDTVVYEVHVKGFTARANSGVAPEKRGTFLGLIEKIPHLKELGVTVVELLPIHQFDPQSPNYWGYMTLNFFAPHSAYSVADGIHEFRQLVRAMHAADIEVWLDVVYNHTAEGEVDGPTHSLRGLDNASYYLHTPSGEYVNDSGCGNTTRCAHPAMRALVASSLRYWAEDMHVDGFRFDLASIFARDVHGAVDTQYPALVHEVSSLGASLNVRLVAEAWDIGTYLLGRSFPGLTWRQWNGCFRDDVRDAVRGAPGKVLGLMRRLYGSDDLFPDAAGDTYRPFQSVNFVTAHDGFCLYDLTAYDHKHNTANGHDNRDGADDNRSWNCGWEGDTGAPPEVLALRAQQAKNFCALLMLANGTPMFCAGDEFLNTQGGNNNPYNQDNEITWLDWSRLEANRGVFRFFCQMIAFRKSHRALGRSHYWREDVGWFGPTGPVDFDHESRRLAFSLRGGDFGEADLYVMVNLHWDPCTFLIQDEHDSDWWRVVDTSLASPDDMVAPGAEVPVPGLQYDVAARSVVLLERGHVMTP